MGCISQVLIYIRVEFLFLLQYAFQLSNHIGGPLMDLIQFFNIFLELAQAFSFQSLDSDTFFQHIYLLSKIHIVRTLQGEDAFSPIIQVVY